MDGKDRRAKLLEHADVPSPEPVAAQERLARVLASWSWTKPLRALSPLARPGDWLRRRAELRVLCETPLLDAVFYLKSYSDVARSGLSAVEHYFRYGAAEGRDPHALFDTEYYLSHGRDLEGFHTPLAHYLQRGAAAGRNPNALFDQAFYQATGGDVAASGLAAVVHYVKIGRAENRRTHPLFDPDYYRERYADARGEGIDPLAHYLRHGLYEDRNPNPLFDVAYYRKRSPDVVAGRVNPVDHYFRFGAREGRNPSPLFDTRLYLRENPGALAAGQNPLAHFLDSLPAGTRPRDTPFAYRSWLAAFPSAPATGRKGPADGEGPLVSLLLTAATRGDLPGETTVASVRAQRYPRWEWRIAVPRGQPALLEEARRRAEGDDRMSVLAVDVSEPAALLKVAMEGAAGDFVAVIDRDCLLEPTALSVFVAELDAFPEAAVLYGDEDQVDEKGLRSSPHFKPEWNQDLFYAWNYLGRPALLRRSTVASVGGIDTRASPAHEYDLLLRVTGAVPDTHIRHVPAIVCHRRVGDLVAADREARGHVLAAHLNVRTPGTEVEASGSFLRPLFPLPQDPPLVSILIPTRDRLPLLRECLDSLLRTTDYPRYEILVVDNDTKDADALAYLAQLCPPIRVIRSPGPFNHSALNNHAASVAQGSVLVLLNNDTTAGNPGWLTEMVRLALRPDVGAVGAKLFYPDGAIQHAGVVIGINGVAGHAFGGRRPGEDGYFGRERLTHEYSAVTAACMALRRSVFEEVNGFDEDVFPINFNDVDLCLRLRSRGYRVLYCAAAWLVHHESASRRNEDGSPILETANESSRFRERWPDWVADDPFYNPNLSLADSFGLAVPPRARPAGSPAASPRLPGVATARDGSRDAPVPESKTR